MSSKNRLLLVAAALLIFGEVKLACGDNTKVMAPSKTKTGPAAGLIIVPGAYIGSDAYIPLGKSIQSSSPYRLWVSTVGGWLANLVNPLQMESKIEDAKKQMTDAGMPGDAVIFIAAHSLGGVFLDMFIRGSKAAAEGIILYGSYINKGVKLADYPVPVLTISGDTDGLCRLTRISRDYQQLKNYTQTTPVILVPGVNHSQIASGPMPSNVLKNDIPAKLTYDQAHEQLATFTNAFMALNGKGVNKTVTEQADKCMQIQHNTTGSILSTYIEATDMDHGTFPFWAQMTQISFANLTLNTKYKLNLTGTEVGYTDQLSMVPSIQKAHNLMVDITQPYYVQNPLNPLDESLVHDSPDLVSTAVLTQSALKQYIPSSQFNSPVNSCSLSNLIAINLASISLPYDYVIRYMQTGKKLKIQPDNVISNLEEWLVAGLEWKQEGDNVLVSSPYYEDKKRMIAYCKVMTSSRAIEYVMIDSLKKQSV